MKTNHRQTAGAQQKSRFLRTSNISHSAVEQFLSRRLDDWAWLKIWDRAAVRTVLAEKGVQFHTEPRDSQAVGTLIGVEQPCFLFQYDVGLGKSKMILDILNHRHRRDEINKPVLILAPSAVNLESWEEQIREHAPNLMCVSLLGTRAERRALLKVPVDIYLLNYAGLQVFMTQHDKDRKKMVPVKEDIEMFVSRFGAVVFDESHLIGNHKTLVYSLCRPISRAVPFRYALTATLFGRDPHMAWPQFDLVDHGETLGKTMGLFRAAFFSPQQNYWSGGVEWKFQKRLKAKLAATLSHRSIRYTADECMDLPEIVRIVRKVRLPTSIEDYYDQVIGQLKAAKGNRQEIERSFLRMRQLTSGFLSIKEDDGRVEHEFDECPKLDSLIELLREIPEDEKIIVFHEFVHSGERIHKAMEELGIKHAQLNGATKDPITELKKFTQTPSCRGLVANWRSAGTGLNLQCAKYAVFFESPVGPIARTQTEGRMSGARQVHRSFIYDLVVADSIDERILAYLKEGKDLMEAVCSGGTSL